MLADVDKRGFLDLIYEYADEMAKHIIEHEDAKGSNSLFL